MRGGGAAVLAAAVGVVDRVRIGKWKRGKKREEGNGRLEDLDKWRREWRLSTC